MRTLPHLLCAAIASAQPAAPLITHDPYVSAWSLTDRLTDDWPRHWSGPVMGMAGLVWIDGSAHRWCGVLPQNVPAAEQKSRTVAVNATTYVFSAGGVELRVEFNPHMGLAEDMIQVSHSASTVWFSATSTDGKPHEVRVYLDMSGEWCTHDPGEPVAWSRHRVEGLDAASMGRVDQPVLRAAGDLRKIDWGRVYLATPAGRGVVGVAAHDRSRAAFASTGALPGSDDLRMPRSANDGWPVLAATIDLGRVAPTAVTAGGVYVAYDEQYAIELFGRKLRPLWNARGNTDVGSRLRELAMARYAGASPAQQAFMAEATAVGGPRYANLLAVAFRQVLAGHKVVADWDGTPLMFSKENTSNGCIATIDVIYPACPFFLYHNPEMLKAQLRPLLAYSASPRWTFPFAPHDLGTYPKANGQVYGGGETGEENQMPVEESGNMLIMLAALAKVEKNADFSKPHLAVLERWAQYLKQHGLDPEHQLCTDDFAGHLARNANLSAKAIVALGSYAQLLDTAGDKAGAARWRAVAEEYAAKWQTMARNERGTVLVFTDDPAKRNTWSQKYNLAWDRALGLNLFPDEVYQREVALYKAELRKYGLPLDSRRTYTKLDWTAWSATLASGREDFDAIMTPVYNWAEASPPPSRVPLSDWYETTDGKTMGMHTRTVVGGLWMPMLMKKLGAK